MTCRTCGGHRHLLHHDLTRARFVCRDCGHLNPWMDEPEWRAALQVMIDVMRGIPGALLAQSDATRAA